jgi:hypothetical protein
MTLKSNYLSIFFLFFFTVIFSQVLYEYYDTAKNLSDKNLNHTLINPEF